MGNRGTQRGTRKLGTAKAGIFKTRNGKRIITVLGKPPVNNTQMSIGWRENPRYLHYLQQRFSKRVFRTDIQPRLVSAVKVTTPHVVWQGVYYSQISHRLKPFPRTDSISSYKTAANKGNIKSIGITSDMSVESNVFSFVTVISCLEQGTMLPFR